MHFSSLLHSNMENGFARPLSKPLLATKQVVVVVVVASHVLNACCFLSFFLSFHSLWTNCNAMNVWNKSKVVKGEKS